MPAYRNPPKATDHNAEVEGESEVADWRARPSDGNPTGCEEFPFGRAPRLLGDDLITTQAKVYLIETGRDRHVWEGAATATLTAAATRRWLRSVDGTRRSWLRDLAVWDYRNGTTALGLFLHTLDRASWVFRCGADNAPATYEERVAIAQDLSALFSGALRPDDPADGRAELAQATVSARIPGGLSRFGFRFWVVAIDPEPTHLLARAVLAGAWSSVSGGAPAAPPGHGALLEHSEAAVRLWRIGIEAGADLGALSSRNQLGSALVERGNGPAVTERAVTLADVRAGMAQLEHGACGLAVLELQEMLLTFGSDPEHADWSTPLNELAKEQGRGRAVNGIFGRATGQSVRQVQQTLGHHESGAVDQLTLLSLEAISGTASRFASLDAIRSGLGTLREGARGLRVEGIQRRLRRLGYRLEISGVLDHSTALAVRDFAPAGGGAVDRLVLRSLDRAVAEL